MTLDMPDLPVNSSIFHPSGFPEIISRFGRLRELAVPVVPALSGGVTLYAVPLYKDKAGLAVMPVFTDPGLVPPPRTVMPVPALLNVVFQSPSAEIFDFDPRAGGGVPAAETRMDKRRLSAVIGYLQTPSPPPSGRDLDAAWRNEAGLGNLHRANYLASLHYAASPAEPRSGAYAELLVNLGLLREACDYARDASTPEFFCSMAAVFRLSMDPVGARLWLDKVPPGTGFEDRKRLELAWLELHEGRTDAALDRFRGLARDSQERTGALLGTGTALLKKAAADKAPDRAKEALEVLSSALSRPTPWAPEVLACMGEAYTISGDHQQAEDCHRKAMVSRPTLRYTIGLGTALLRNGKFREAAHLITGLALIDPGSAGRLAAGLPRDSAAQLLELSRQNPETPVRSAAQEAAPAPPPPPPTMLPIGAGTTPLPPSGPRAGAAPSAPPPPPPSGRTAPGLQMESLMEAASVSLPTETEVRKDDFMGRAFRLASVLEEETGKKIFFNSEGLVEAEKRLRLVFVKALDERQKHVEIVKDCAAFLCFILQERLHGRLVKMPDFDEWGWPVVFEYPKRLTTYPVQRVWRLLWQGDLPEPGWLINYLRYIEEELGSERAERPHGAEAVRGRVSSHTERLADADTEHRRIMTLASTLHETSEIEIGRTGVDKLENAIKWNFRPDTPPTKDGWKILRCYGHILAEILMKDFKAVWYNTDGNDGMWSLLTPWNTFIFPIGKVYKAASLGGGLRGYYDALLGEKLQAAGKPQA